MERICYRIGYAAVVAWAAVAGLLFGEWRAYSHAIREAERATTVHRTVYHPAWDAVPGKEAGGERIPPQNLPTGR
jgi:hypothetical protein